MDNSATISSQLSIVNCQLGVLKSYFPTLTDAQKQQIDALFDLYSDWNSKINVISGLTSVSFSFRIRIPCRNLVNPGGTSWISRQDDYLWHHMRACFIRKVNDCSRIWFRPFIRCHYMSSDVRNRYSIGIEAIFLFHKMYFYWFIQ